MANVARNVNFRFTPTGFVVECAPSQTPEHASSRTTSGRKVTQAKVGVISISPQPQESDGNWTVVLSRKTKAKNLKSRRANSPVPRAERPITRNAAKKNSEIAPPAIYPKQTVSQSSMHDFPTLIASRGKQTKDQKG